MKIHTKHLALCEKGGKFNKRLNTICKLQEDLIEPQAKWKNIFVSLIDEFFQICYILRNTPAADYKGRFQQGWNLFLSVKSEVRSLF